MLPKSLLKKFADSIEERFGLYFSEKNYPDLEKKIQSIAKKNEFQDSKEFLKQFFENEEKFNESVISTITIGETYFFREKQLFKILKEKVLPELLFKPKKAIKIWSCGCCTGEETYSLAILIKQYFPILLEKNLNIIGTDINLHFLSKARYGHYKEWAFRNTSEETKRDYFSLTHENKYAIHSDIKKLCHFDYFNLVESIPLHLIEQLQEVDLIFCCNTLMYFSQKQISKILNLFDHVLADRGVLMVNAIEVPFIHHPKFHLVREHGSSYFIKNPEPLKPIQPQFECRRRRPTKKKQKLVFSKEPKIAPNLKTKSPIEKIEELADEGNLNEALSLTIKAIEEDQVSEELYFLLSSIQQALSQSDEAVQSLKKALFLNQNFLAAHFVLGNLFIKQNKMKEAQKELSNCKNLLKEYRLDDEIPWLGGITAQSLDVVLTNLLNKEINLK